MRINEDLGMILLITNPLLKLYTVQCTYIGMNNRYREEKTESNNATKVIKIRDDA